MPHEKIGIVVFICFAMLAMLVVFCFFRDGRTIQRWAREQGFEFVTLERRFIRVGPFWIGHDYESVFRIQVTTGSSGPMRSGFVMVTNSFSRTVKVIWDTAASP